MSIYFNNSEIDALSGIPIVQNGVDTSSADATPMDILFRKTAYVKGNLVTGNIQSIPGKVITPSTEKQQIGKNVFVEGDIIVNPMPNGGFMSDGSFVPGYIENLSSAKGQTITPSAVQKTLKGNTYYTSDIIVKGLPEIKATTYTPGTTNQVIQSGNLLSGNQTILGDSDLIPRNILKGVSIFNVQGNLDARTVLVGTAEPTASIGADGDFYMVVK